MKSKAFFHTIALVGLLLGANPARAQIQLDLVLCIDGSGSISDNEFTLQLNGTAQAIETVIPTDGTVRLSVLQFDDATAIEIQPTVITGSNRAAVATAVRNIVQLNGGTDIAECIDVAATILDITPASARQVIDLSTDGQSDQTAAEASATAAQTAGIDALNALLVGTGVNVNLANAIVFPKPVGGNAGFVQQIANFNEYATAIRDKITTEITGSAPIARDAYFGICNLSDLNGNGTIEIAAGTALANGRPVVIIKDSLTKKFLKLYQFFNTSWRGTALSCEINKISVLAVLRRNESVIAAQTRNPVNGSLLTTPIVMFPKF